jgi:hypothetical protein
MLHFHEHGKAPCHSADQECALYGMDVFMAMVGMMCTCSERSGDHRYENNDWA